jgi:hypothetical protein
MKVEGTIWEVEGTIWEEEGDQQEMEWWEKRVTGVNIIKVHYMHVGKFIVYPIILQLMYTLIKLMENKKQFHYNICIHGNVTMNFHV